MSEWGTGGNEEEDVFEIGDEGSDDEEELFAGSGSEDFTHKLRSATN